MILDQIEDCENELRLSKSKTVEIVSALTTQIRLREETMLNSLQNFRNETDKSTEELKRQLAESEQNLVDAKARACLNEDFKLEAMKIQANLTALEEDLNATKYVLPIEPLTADCFYAAVLLCILFILEGIRALKLKQ